MGFQVQNIFNLSPKCVLNVFTLMVYNQVFDEKQIQIL